MRGRLKKAANDPLYGRYRTAFTSARTGHAFLEPAGGEVRASSDFGRNSEVCYPRVAIYVGSGASHSWIWFTDLLERLGLFDVQFIDEGAVSAAGLERYDFILIGGGDTYAMAESMGEAGAHALSSRVESGGLYFGSCAGAYLVLSRVDLKPFTPFDLVEGDMLNVMVDPPAPRCLEHKYLAPYGDEWVFHPVYGEVSLSPRGQAREYPCFQGANAIPAVLFGGPVISTDRADDVLARFAGLTDRAAYPWPRRRAERLLLERAAVLRAEISRGTVLVSGPHLEHPLFPRSNALAAEVFLRHSAYRMETSAPRPPAETGSGSGGDGATALEEIKRQVSNARIVGFGLEKLPVTWKMGLKVWEPEKIRMFLDYTWNRLPYATARAGSAALPGLDDMAAGFGRVTDLTRSVKIKVESGEDSSEEALTLLLTLKELTASFLALYFRLRLDESPGL